MTYNVRRSAGRDCLPVARWGPDRVFPSLKVLAACEVEYEELPGWDGDIGGARAMSELPANARRYVERVSQLTGAAVSVVGVGPDREQTLLVDRGIFA